MTDSDPTFTALGNEKFVSLTTFRKNGAPVSTAVWIACDGDELIVTTPKESGKVKRLKNNPRVEIRPSSRRGTVESDAPVWNGVAEVVDTDAARAALTQIFKSKYGWEYRIFMVIERIVARRQKPRVQIRISPVSLSDETSAGG